MISSAPIAKVVKSEPNETHISQYFYGENGEPDGLYIFCLDEKVALSALASLQINEHAIAPVQLTE
jgi:hypothetical protein